jgi:hypothetical protein
MVGESSHKALKRVWKVRSISSTTRAVGWVYILISLKLAVRIRKLVVVTVQERHCHPPRNRTGHLTKKP